MKVIRSEFPWLDRDGTPVVQSDDGVIEWWTFAGTAANATLAYELSQATRSRVTYDNLSVTFESHVSADAIEQALRMLRTRDVKTMRPAVEEKAIDGLKFSECLPQDLAVRVVESRLRDPSAVEYTIHELPRFVVNH